MGRQFRALKKKKGDKVKKEERKISDKKKEKDTRKTSKAAISKGDEIPPTTKVGVIVGEGTDIALDTLSELAITSANFSMSATAIAEARRVDEWVGDPHASP